METQDAEHSRVAQCECGAALVGTTQAELYDAVQAHIAHHHPELMGALGARTIEQMAEGRPHGRRFAPSSAVVPPLSG